MSRQINLFNPVFLKQKKYFSAVTMAQSLGLILLGIILVVVYANFQLTKLSEEAVVVAANLNASQSQLAKIDAESGSRQRNTSVADALKKSEADAKGLQQVFEVLRKGEFGNTKGYSDYLRAFSRQIVDGLWLTGIRIYGAGNEIGIEGRATKPDLIPVYIGRLKDEAVMQGKAFSSLEMQVPSVAPVNANDSTADKFAVPANFIEFSLQSSGGNQELTATVGASVK